MTQEPCHRYLKDICHMVPSQVWNRPLKFSTAGHWACWRTGGREGWSLKLPVGLREEKVPDNYNDKASPKLWNSSKRILASERRWRDGLEWMMCSEGIQAGVQRGPTFCTQVDCLIVKIWLKADGLNIDFYKLCVRKGYHADYCWPAIWLIVSTIILWNLLLIR